MEGATRNMDDSPKLFNQIVASILSCLGPLIFGITMGFSSPAIPELQKPVNESGMSLSTEGCSWFSSLVTVGALVGGPIAAVLIDKTGRKTGIMISTVPFSVGYFLIIFASNAIILYIGRILTGIGTGMCSVAVPTYIAEISSKELRGATGAGFQLSITLGVLIMFAVGLWLHYTWLAVLASGITALLLISMIFLPESPTWLLRHGKKAQALIALHWLRGKEPCVEKECVDIENNLALLGSAVGLRDIFRTPALYKPLYIIIVTMVFQQLSGINAVIFNSNSIFQGAGFSNSAGIPAVILAVVQVVMTFISCLIMDKAGRKFLLILSGSLMSVSCITFSLYYIFEDKHIADPKKWYMKALSLGSLAMYISMFSIGWGPVPWLYMSEILPAKVRGTCSGLATAVNWSVSFLVTKFFTDLQNLIKPYGVFFLFSGTNFFGVLFVLIFIIETKGRSLEEIERHITQGESNYQVLNDGDSDNETENLIQPTK